MKRYYIVLFSLALILLTGCAKEYNVIYKSSDYSYRYEYAKEQFAKGKYERASIILGDMITMLKGTENAEESLYLYGMSNMLIKDYESASEIFKKYYTTYPSGIYAEQSRYYVGECMYASVPEPRLDQTPTYTAMKAYQEFMDAYPDSDKKGEAERKLYELQDKLVYKEYLNAKLYYNLGTYFGNCTSGGNNYEACIVTAQNAIKDYPFTNMREDFSLLIMKSKFELAVHSIKEKQTERFQDAEDECYGFINEYPDSKERATAEKYIDKCKKFSKGQLIFD